MLIYEQKTSIMKMDSLKVKGVYEMIKWIKYVDKSGSMTYLNMDEVVKFAIEAVGMQSGWCVVAYMKEDMEDVQQNYLSHYGGHMPKRLELKSYMTQKDAEQALESILMDANGFRAIL